MRASLGGEGERGIKQIHEPGLAAPDATPEIHATRCLTITREAAQDALAEGRGGGFGQLGAQSLKMSDRVELRRIRFEMALGNLPGVQIAQDVRGFVHSSW